MRDNLTLGLARVGVLNAAGEYDRAIADSETILKNQPGSLAAVNNLVSLLLDNRTDKPSLDRAQGLVEQLRGSRVPYFQDTLGWALHLRGNSPEAQPLLEQAKAQLPTIAAIRYHLAMVYRATGETAKAVDELKSALELEVTDTVLRRKIQSAMN